ncbi:alpha/beta hydrolase [Agromyces laixinhei]|uniref:alpha/beta hydrolase n=1 Tax=Agromyces laixinhei TaxID=2585717 RepID=UPI00111722C2|nr:alpha/beta hydrolase [Agromyces laixinhei]
MNEWTRQQPGAGSVDDLRYAAGLRRSKAETLRGTTVPAVERAATAAGAQWSSVTAVAFTGAVAATTADIQNLVNSLEIDAAALDRYATTIEQIAGESHALEAKARGIHSDVGSWNRSLDRLTAEAATPGAPLGPSSEIARVDDLLEGAASKLALIEAQRDELVARRESADRECIASLTGLESRGQLGRMDAISTETTPAAALALLAGLSAAEIRAALAMNPNLADLVARAAPEDVAAWWNGYNLDGDAGTPASEHLALIAAMPAVIGNLGGVAYWARDKANRIQLAAEIKAAKADIARTRAEAATQRPYAVNLELPQQKLDALLNIKDALDTRSGVERQLVGLTDDNPPLAQIAVGDLDSAENVTYAIPGMSATTADMSGWTAAAQNLYLAQHAVDGGTAHSVVAWVGYETPPVPGYPDFNFGVLHGDYADTGAGNLIRDLEGFNATREGRDVSLNVVGHSYGTTTATLALYRSDLNVDAFVSIGSAGIEPVIGTADSVQADTFYAGQAQDVIPQLEAGDGDQWAWTGREGSGRANPMDDSFGATTFGTNGIDGDPAKNPVTDHSTTMKAPDFGYLDRRTESLSNVAFATTGQPERMSVHTPPQMTDTQRMLLEGMRGPSL